MAFDVSTQVRSSGTGDSLHMVGFTVGGEEFCIDILKVQEIIRMVDITVMPNAPDYVEGVINLRGKIIPIIDFRKRMHLPFADNINEQNRRIVVVSFGKVTVGLVVDKVSQVMKLNADQVSATPDVIKGFDSECLMGVGRAADRLLILLDVEKMFRQDEFEGLADAA
ncbi:MAG: chemotaxis protein CheW [Geobacter sp.]|nr:purine-binding chemotaxis protein CheW [Geobacter sp.]MSM38008.1 chemotaxis protein CheW [Geobacter sp.]